MLTTLLYSLLTPTLKCFVTATETFVLLVFEWFIANRLFVNFNKTHSMVFGHSLLTSGCTLNISNHVIQLVNERNISWYFIDEKLNR